jgi:hypothetical protein
MRIVTSEFLPDPPRTCQFVLRFTQVGATRREIPMEPLQVCESRESNAIAESVTAFKRIPSVIQSRHLSQEI